MNTGSYESGEAVPWGQSRRNESPIYSQPPAYQSSDHVQHEGLNTDGPGGVYPEMEHMVSTAPLLLSVSST
jgi:hypothetical protein